MTTSMVPRQHTSGDKKKRTSRREGPMQRHQSQLHRPANQVRLPPSDGQSFRRTSLAGGTLTDNQVVYLPLSSWEVLVGVSNILLFTKVSLSGLCTSSRAHTNGKLEQCISNPVSVNPMKISLVNELSTAPITSYLEVPPS